MRNYEINHSIDLCTYFNLHLHNLYIHVFLFQSTVFSTKRPGNQIPSINIPFFTCTLRLT